MKDLRKIPQPHRSRIVAAFERLAELGLGDVRSVENSGGEDRLRVGDWRVRLLIQDDAISVLHIRPRGSAYG